MFQTPFIKMAASSVKRTSMIITPDPMSIGVIVMAILGFRTDEMTERAAPAMLLSRKAPNAIRGSLDT